MFIGVAASQLNLATRTKTPRRQTKRRQQHAEAEEDELSQTAERCAGFFQGCVLALVPGAKRVSHRASNHSLPPAKWPMMQNILPLITFGRPQQNQAYTFIINPNVV